MNERSEKGGQSASVDCHLFWFGVVILKGPSICCHDDTEPDAVKEVFDFAAESRPASRQLCVLSFLPF